MFNNKKIKNLEAEVANLNRSLARYEEMLITIARIIKVLPETVADERYNTSQNLEYMSRMLERDIEITKESETPR